VWNVTIHLSAVSGSGCVADTMRSQIGVPSAYSLSITQTGLVTLRSAAGEYACTFRPLFDSSGFTTYGQGGFYSCEQTFLDFRCSNGTLHSIFTFGEDISGRVSGTEMTGSWDAFWVEGMNDSGIETKAQFTAAR
jgi:hypothetical protein